MQGAGCWLRGCIALPTDSSTSSILIDPHLQGVQVEMCSLILIRLFLQRCAEVEMCVCVCVCVCVRVCVCVHMHVHSKKYLSFVITMGNCRSCTIILFLDTIGLIICQGGA